MTAPKTLYCHHIKAKSLTAPRYSKSYSQKSFLLLCTDGAAVNDQGAEAEVLRGDGAVH